MNLFQIIREAEDISNLIAEAGGELTPEIEQKIEDNKLMLRQKLDAYCFVIEEMKQRQAYAVAKMNDWEKIASLCDKAIESLTSRVLSVLNETESGESHGQEFTCKIRLNPPSVQIVDEALIPGEFLITETKTRLDKKAISEAIKGGQQVSGAALIQKQSLTMKPAQKFLESK